MGVFIISFNYDYRSEPKGWGGAVNNSGKSVSGSLCPAPEVKELIPVTGASATIGGSERAIRTPSAGPHRVAQLSPTVCDAMDCSSPGSSVHENFQARILEWVAIPFSFGPEIKYGFNLSSNFSRN